MTTTPMTSAAVTRICFIGAGSVVFTRQLLRDLFRFDDLGPLSLSLHDIDPDRLETARLTAEQLARQLGSTAVVTASLDRRRALAGADFVVNVVQVGGIAATRIDFEVPARFGLRQTIADTLGAGGVFRALRTFPLLRELAADMRTECPGAWLLNYTNPMAMNVWWLSVVAPELPFVGLCHSVYWTVHDLCALLGVPMDDVDYRAAGVNHQAWLLDWRQGGEDLYPRLRQLVAQDEQLRRRVRVDMFTRLGYYPTETSEHSSEYVPWYLHHDSEIERLRIPVDDYLGISADNVSEYERTREALANGTELPMDDGDEPAEYAPQVIHSMVTGTQRTIHANLPNRGLIDNLPAGSAVEVPATVDRLGVHPQAMGALPPQCAALNRAFLSVAELTVQAALEEDPRLVRQALLVDPNTAATLTPPRIAQLCHELAAAHGDYLPGWVRG